MVIDPNGISTKDFHQFLLGAVAPRPIAFVSTLDENGIPNLAPYSFFNAFSSNPPICVFSSNRRVEDQTTKDTLHNIQVNKEAVINVVSYSIVQQMAITSIEVDRSINEFDYAGLTQVPSDLVKPFRVKESPVNMECRVNEVITLGAHGGAGHLIICEVIRMHIHDSVLNEKGKIDPHKIDLVGRMGGTWYTRASGNAIFNLMQPFKELVIGYQALPEFIRQSHLLSANEIGLLARCKTLPEDSEISNCLMKDSDFLRCSSKQELLEQKI